MSLCYLMWKLVSSRVSSDTYFAQKDFYLTVVNYSSYFSELGDKLALSCNKMRYLHVWVILER